MNQFDPKSAQNQWWGAIQKPSFHTQELREEAQEHFGDQGYSTGQLFALCNDDHETS